MKIIDNQGLKLLNKSSRYLFVFYNLDGVRMFSDKCTINEFYEKIKNTNAPNGIAKILCIYPAMKQIDVTLFSLANVNINDLINANMSMKEINEYYKQNKSL